MKLNNILVSNGTAVICDFGTSVKVDNDGIVKMQPFLEETQNI